jgi:hypothetical protein
MSAADQTAACHRVREAKPPRLVSGAVCLSALWCLAVPSCREGKALSTRTLEEQLLAELREAEEGSESSTSKRTSSYDGHGNGTGASGSTGIIAVSLYA